MSLPNYFPSSRLRSGLPTTPNFPSFDPVGQSLDSYVTLSLVPHCHPHYILAEDYSEEQPTEAARSQAKSQGRALPALVLAGRIRRINRDRNRNSRPCKSCRRREFKSKWSSSFLWTTVLSMDACRQCKIIPGLTPCLCEWCMDQGFESCNAGLYQRAQRREQVREILILWGSKVDSLSKGNVGSP